MKQNIRKEVFYIATRQELFAASRFIDQATVNLIQYRKRVFMQGGRSLETERILRVGVERILRVDSE